MIKSYQLNSYVKETEGKGRGVFALRNLGEDETVEVAQLLVLSESDSLIVEDTILTCYQYYFNEKQVAIGLGHSSLYNHSDEPNAEFLMDEESKTVTIKALRKIDKDEEILLDYGYSLNENSVGDHSSVD